MKIAEIPKKIYTLQVDTITLIEDISKSKLEKKSYSDTIMGIISHEVVDNKKKFKNQSEREIEFGLRVLKDSTFLKLDNDLRNKEVTLKKKRYLVDYYTNMIKMLPFRDAEVEEIE